MLEMTRELGVGIGALVEGPVVPAVQAFLERLWECKGYYDEADSQIDGLTVLVNGLNTLLPEMEEKMARRKHAMTKEKYERFQEVARHVWRKVGQGERLLLSVCGSVETREGTDLQQKFDQEQDPREKEQLETSIVKWKTKFRVAWKGKGLEKLQLQIEAMMLFLTQMYHIYMELPSDGQDVQGREPSYGTVNAAKRSRLRGRTLDEVRARHLAENSPAASSIELQQHVDAPLALVDDSLLSDENVSRIPLQQWSDSSQTAGENGIDPSALPEAEARTSSSSQGSSGTERRGKLIQPEPSEPVVGRWAAIVRLCEAARSRPEAEGGKPPRSELEEYAHIESIDDLVAMLSLRIQEAQSQSEAPDSSSDGIYSSQPGSPTDSIDWELMPPPLFTFRDIERGLGEGKGKAAALD